MSTLPRTPSLTPERPSKRATRREVRSMEKHQILEHIRRIEAEEREEQLLEALAPPTTALVPVSQQNRPPIVESTIIIQEPPLPDEEPEPIRDMQPPKKRRGSF